MKTFEALWVFTQGMSAAGLLLTAAWARRGLASAERAG